MYIVVLFFFSAASAPSNLMAVQEGLTNVSVSWSPPTPLGDTTGYRISYSGGSSGSVDVSDGSTSTRTLTGLMNGASYIISIVCTSLHLPSEVVEVDIGLGERYSSTYLSTCTCMHVCTYPCTCVHDYAHTCTCTCTLYMCTYIVP